MFLACAAAWLCCKMLLHFFFYWVIAAYTYHCSLLCVWYLNLWEEWLSCQALLLLTVWHMTESYSTHKLYSIIKVRHNALSAKRSYQIRDVLGKSLWSSWFHLVSDLKQPVWLLSLVKTWLLANEALLCLYIQYNKAKGFYKKRFSPPADSHWRYSTMGWYQHWLLTFSKVWCPAIPKNTWNVNRKAHHHCPFWQGGLYTHSARKVNGKNMTALGS